ncbi:MAG: CBS domain-containing protein [Hyphomicrobiaceae bacterium]
MYNFLECTVGQFMVGQPKALHPSLTLRELELLFEADDFNGYPVLEDGKLVGFVTKFDFLKAFAFTTQQLVPHYDELMLLTVGEIMTTSVIHVSPDQPLTRALQLMLETRARSFPVLDDGGKLVGVISRQDIMRALNQATLSTRKTAKPSFETLSGTIP